MQEFTDKKKAIASIRRMRTADLDALLEQSFRIYHAVNPEQQSAGIIRR